jgi:rhodanese-related sulfurtransferase
MKEITPGELKQRLDKGEDIVIVDVRETYEHESSNLGGKNIPLYSLLSRLDEIPHDKTVVFHCRSGSRSASAIMELERRHNYLNLYNLKGGILAWANEVDPSIAI